MMRHATGKWATLGTGALALLLICWAEGKSQPDREEGARTVRGTVRRFTTAPKGEIDGLVLDDGTVIHWPPHLEARFKAIVAKGDRVEVIGRRETGPEGDSKIEVRNFTNLRTRAAGTNDEDRLPPPPPPKKGPKGPKGKFFGELKRVRGTVARFTTAPKGEIDGLVLGDDTVIHWPPHLEARFKAIVAKGDRVEVIGRRETGPEGDSKIEVRKLTNLRTGIARTNEDVPPPPAALESREGSTEERLRALEDKLDRLTEELRRLKRE